MLRHIASVLVVLILFTAGLLPAAVTRAAAEPAWHLVEVVDYPNADKFDAASEHPSYDYKGSYAPLSYGITITFVGKSDSSTRPPKVQGESLTIQARSSAPPAVINRGETVSLDLTLAVTENTQSFFTFSGGIRAYFDSVTISPGGITGSAIRLENEKKQSYFEVTKGTGYASVSEKVVAAPRAGSRTGAQMALLIVAVGQGTPMGTKYIYEWRDSPGQPAPPPQPQPLPQPQPQPTRPPAPPAAPPPANPELQPCGARFGDLTGEVNVKQHGEDDDAYIFAELSTPLYHDTQIRTRFRSGAIISYADMATYVMKEDSIIVLDCVSPRESKTMLLLGNVWVNLKRMVKDGSMEIEMSQAVAGIKGTTLILAEDGQRSTVKVIEGSVQVTPKGGQSVTLSGGQQVTAADGKSGKITEFSVADEMQSWSPGTQQMTAEILTGLAPASPQKGGSGSSTLLIALLVVGGGLTAFLLKRKK